MVRHDFELQVTSKFTVLGINNLFKAKGRINFDQRPTLVPQTRLWSHRFLLALLLICLIFYLKHINSYCIFITFLLSWCELVSTSPRYHLFIIALLLFFYRFWSFNIASLKSHMSSSRILYHFIWRASASHANDLRRWATVCKSVRLHNEQQASLIIRAQLKR